jgi:glycosyltransferase involved in cell wall biosynthesis
MFAVYNALDLLVLPSLYEGLPLVALEAGAMAKPIIVTSVDGSKEAVINNKTGIVINPQDSMALKEALENILNNTNLVKEFGNNARTYIEKEFDIRKQIIKTESLYKRLI